MTRSVSWPMYAIDPGAVAEFWRRLRQALAASGLPGVPATLAEPADLPAHWRDPALLLSHTCGFPLVTSLAGRVRYVATPRFAVPGCEGGFYRSAVVVRHDDPARSLAALAGRRVAFNSRDSQSGYNGLRALVAPHAVEGRFFSGAVETGAHRRSLRAVASRVADVAAIDAVTLALVADHAPRELDGLRILDHTALVPGLPLITAATTSDAELAQLRQVAIETCGSASAWSRALRLDGAEVLPDGSYDVLLAQRDAAVARGYPELA